VWVYGSGVLLLYHYIVYIDIGLYCSTRVYHALDGFFQCKLNKFSQGPRICRATHGLV